MISPQIPDVAPSVNPEKILWCTWIKLYQVQAAVMYVFSCGNLVFSDLTPINNTQQITSTDSTDVLQIYCNKKKKQMD